ncbi:MAG: response regulator transcription factor [bacterium]
MWHDHLAMEIRPLLHPVAPIPQFSLWNADYVPELVLHREKDPASILSPRELEVARRPATGESRPFIAKSLGISTNTVATTSKRIYAKLGVNNRAAIASRMAQA